MGEVEKQALVRVQEAVAAVLAAPVAVDTFAGRLHVEWDAAAAVTPLGQLPFFIEFLKVSGLFERFVQDCPLEYSSPNAPSKRDVLGTLMLSILSGHHRYAHITASLPCVSQLHDGQHPIDHECGGAAGQSHGSEF